MFAPAESLPSPATLCVRVTYVAQNPSVSHLHCDGLLMLMLIHANELTFYYPMHWVIKRQ